jgi:hypothetical protein
MKKLLMLLIAVISVITVQAQKYQVLAIKITDIEQPGLQWGEWKNPKSSETYLYIDKSRNKIIYVIDEEIVFNFTIRQALSDEVKNNVRRVSWSATSEGSTVEMWYFTRYNESTSSLYIYYDEFAVCLGLKAIE